MLEPMPRIDSVDSNSSLRIVEQRDAHWRRRGLLRDASQTSFESLSI